MAKFPTFVEGYDPTADVTAVSRAQLLQMVHEAEHVDYIGPIIGAVSAPNVVTYPKLKFFFWHRLNADRTGTGELYWYDVSVADWSPLEIPLGTLSGANFADGSITLAKLGGTGLTPGYIVRVNSLGTGFEAVPLDTIIAAGTLALNKLFNAPGTDYMIVSGAGGVWSAVDVITYIGDLLTTASLVSHKAIYDGDNTGSQYQVLGRGAGDNAGVTWAYIESLLRANQTPTSKLQFAAGLAGKVLKVNSDANDVEGIPYYAQTPPYRSAQTSLPTGAGFANAVSFATGLGGRPRFIQGWLICTDAGGDGGWAQNDVIPIDCVAFDTTTTTYFNGRYAFIPVGETVYLMQPDAGASTYFLHKTTGDATVFTSTKWKVIVEASI